MLWLGSRGPCRGITLNPLTGAEAESGGGAPSPASQQAPRNHQAPRGNKTRHRPGNHSHPHVPSIAPPTDDGISGGRKIGQSAALVFTPSVLFQIVLSFMTAIYSVFCECFWAVYDFSPTASNIDRSVKDLQRCTASLTRYRMVVKEEMDSSIKRMKQTFAELQSWCVSVQAKSR